MKNPFQKYESEFSEKNLWQKLLHYAKKAGVKSVYAVLLMYYAYRRKETPSWARHVILGVIGYFIAPIDAIPDLTPIIGYTDDLGVLSFGLVTVATYIDTDVRTKARTKIEKWFGDYDPKELEEIDGNL